MPDEIEILPKSRIISVRAEFTLALPLAATREEIEAWVKFELGIEPWLDDNPLENYGIEVLKGETYLSDTRLHLHETVTENDDGTYRVHKTAQENVSDGPSASQQMMAIVAAKRDARRTEN